MSGASFDPADGVITHRGIVNTPECDENGHMTVQFYWVRFALADQQFRMLHGLNGAVETDAERLSWYASQSLTYH